MKYAVCCVLMGVAQMLSAQISAEDYERFEAMKNPASKPFSFGVASGEPLSDRVMIWTFLDLPDTEEALVSWEMAEDRLFQQIIQTGETWIRPNEETGRVLIDVLALKPATFYFYRFTHNGTTSRTGRTKTAPEGNCDKVVFAVVSCQNYEAGYYNAYRNLAMRTDIDVVLHLGDYIYEYKPGYYGNKSTGRVHLPTHEIVSEEDYYMRFAQYRLDPDLQNVHALFPFITIWDDHEFANDSHLTGAQNHQSDTEGDWETRKANAKKAYYTWLPVRPQMEGKLYRRFQFGSMADLWMLDERQEGRTPQAKGADDPIYANEDRAILGSVQFAWLTQGMATSTAQWRVIGNQVIMSSIDVSKVMPKNPKFMDMWDGYPAERMRLMNFMEKQNMRNVVVVSGDSHTSWANDLVGDPSRLKKKEHDGCVGAEYAVPSISSANYDEYVKHWKAKEAERRFTRWGRNPQVQFNDVCNHGYLVLTLTPEQALGEWIFMKRIDALDDTTRKGTRYRLKQGEQGISKVN